MVNFTSTLSVLLFSTGLRMQKKRGALSSLISARGVQNVKNSHWFGTISREGFSENTIEAQKIAMLL